MEHWKTNYSFYWDNENEDLWFNATLGQMELETLQQKHKGSMLEHKPNIEKEGNMSPMNLARLFCTKSNLWWIIFKKVI
jgi:hypothetical protein